MRLPVGGHHPARCRRRSRRHSPPAAGAGARAGRARPASVAGRRTLGEAPDLARRRKARGAARSPANVLRCMRMPLSPANIRANVLVKLGELTGKTHALPLVLFAPTARCNSRCVSCDWWRADGAGDLSLAEIETLAGDLERAGTRVVVLTGGEPLVRPDVMAVADCFARAGWRCSCSRSGLALGRYADDVAARFQTVTVSRWTGTPRAVPSYPGVDGLGAVARGVASCGRGRRTIADHRAGHHPSPQFPLPARSGREVARDGAGANFVSGGERRRRSGGVQSRGRDCRRRRTMRVHPRAAVARCRRGRRVRGDCRDGDPRSIPIPWASDASPRTPPGCAAWSALPGAPGAGDLRRAALQRAVGQPVHRGRRGRPAVLLPSRGRQPAPASPRGAAVEGRCRRFGPASTWRAIRSAPAASVR